MDARQDQFTKGAESVPNGETRQLVARRPGRFPRAAPVTKTTLPESFRSMRRSPSANQSGLPGVNWDVRFAVSDFNSPCKPNRPPPTRFVTRGFSSGAERGALLDWQAATRVIKLTPIPPTPATPARPPLSIAGIAVAAGFYPGQRMRRICSTKKNCAIPVRFKPTGKGSLAAL
jgi:hypothetical protein